MLHEFSRLLSAGGDCESAHATQNIALFWARWPPVRFCSHAMAAGSTASGWATAIAELLVVGRQGVDCTGDDAAGTYQRFGFANWSNRAGVAERSGAEPDSHRAVLEGRAGQRTGGVARPGVARRGPQGVCGW